MLSGGGEVALKAGGMGRSVLSTQPFFFLAVTMRVCAAFSRLRGNRLHRPASDPLAAKG